MLGRKKGGHFELCDPIHTKNLKNNSKNELKSRFGCGNSTLWLHYTMENAAKSKQTQICHQIYPKNTLKRKNHKKVEIAWVVILASDFRFFHTVLHVGQARRISRYLITGVLIWKPKSKQTN